MIPFLIVEPVFVSKMLEGRRSVSKGPFGSVGAEGYEQTLKKRPSLPVGCFMLTGDNVVGSLLVVSKGFVIAATLQFSL